jgi:hypothetical protein
MMMRLKHTSLAIALIVGATPVAYPQAPQTHRNRDTPDFRVEVWGDIVADFSTRVRSYVDLRTELEKGLPALTVTDDPAEIRRAIRSLGKRIRAARAEAKQGDLFTPAITAEFRRALLLEMDVNIWDTLMDDNPGKFSQAINRTYPTKRPLSTVPVNILARLPRLPDDIEYHFLGRDLVLLDTRASVILDRIPYAISARRAIN